MVTHLAQIDHALAAAVAKGLGIPLERRPPRPPNVSVPADGDPAAFQHRDLVDRDSTSAALSMAVTAPGSIATRKIAVLVTQSAAGVGLASMLKASTAAGAVPALTAPDLGVVTLDDGATAISEYSILTASSVLFDALYV